MPGRALVAFFGSVTRFRSGLRRILATVSHRPSSILDRWTSRAQSTARPRPALTGPLSGC